MNTFRPIRRLPPRRVCIDNDDLLTTCFTCITPSQLRGDSFGGPQAAAMHMSLRTDAVRAADPKRSQALSHLVRSTPDATNVIPAERHCCRFRTVSVYEQAVKGDGHTQEGDRNDDTPSSRVNIN